VKYINLSIQIALLGKLLQEALITQNEYEILLKHTMMDYDVSSLVI